MRRIPIRMKLAGALAVPLLALGAVTLLEVLQAGRDAQRVRDQSTLAEASIGPVSLLSLLENERNAAAVYLLAAEDAFALPVKDNAEARDFVDEALTEFRAEVEGRGGEIEAAYAPEHFGGFHGTKSLPIAWRRLSEHSSARRSRCS